MTAHHGESSLPTPTSFAVYLPTQVTGTQEAGRSPSDRPFLLCLRLGDEAFAHEKGGVSAAFGSSIEREA